jgi:hypothetical protein
MFVQGVKFSDVAILIVDQLSSWTLQKNFGLFMCTVKIVCNSFISIISGITSCNADDVAMYPALAVLRAISV